MSSVILGPCATEAAPGWPGFGARNPAGQERRSGVLGSHVVLAVPTRGFTRRVRQPQREAGPGTRR